MQALFHEIKNKPKEARSGGAARRVPLAVVKTKPPAKFD
jgi:hypothetical protein